jgi:hypothetical protein
MMARAWIWIMTAALVCLGGAAAAQDQPPCTVTIESTSVALGVGVSWGDGVLSCGGTTRHFSVRGLSVVDLGVAKVSARGKVSNLKKVDDFAGTYAAAQAGAAVGGGMSAVVLRNQNGVVLELTSTQTGVKLTLAGEGIEVKLK